MGWENSLCVLQPNVANPILNQTRKIILKHVMLHISWKQDVIAGTLDNMNARYETSGPDRLAFDQECSTSNEFVEVKSEINEDEPTRSGDVTIKDAQSAFKVVRKFVEAKFDAPTVLRMCKDLDAVLANDT
ncbi:hypothetical protein Ddc_11356 [Ditylenchus destructor]|nr:hypothetical protein Ddc_11356 [Ditylenchus destructor]